MLRAKKIEGGSRAVTPHICRCRHWHRCGHDQIGIPADAKRLMVAKRIGADTVLGAQGEDVAEWVRNFGDGYGVDLVIDAAGVSASLKTGARYCASRGPNHQSWMGTTAAQFFARSAGAEGGHSTRQLFSQLADLGESHFPAGERQDRSRSSYSIAFPRSTNGTRRLRRCIPA